MSSPYQSNILRFLVGQYRAGVDRHRRAVMITRSTVALGVEVGSVLAMTPVYAAVRMSQSVGRKLRQSVMNRRLLEPFSKAMSTVRTVVGWVVPIDAEKSDERVIAPSASQSNIAHSDSIQSGEISSNKAQGSLVWPIRSFWVAVLHAIANLNRRNAKKLQSAFTALPETTATALPNRWLSKRLRSNQANAMPLPRGKVGDALRSVSVLEVDLEAAADRCLDAKVVAFEYVEHPLEAVLKWIDRILTWAEGQWQRLLDVWHRWLLRGHNR